MKIHTVKEGETLSSIGELYGLSGELIKRDNGLLGEGLLVGEELLILMPTRTHRARRGESIDGLCHRFGLERRELLAQNPGIDKGELGGRLLGLKYKKKPYGALAANGYFYKGSSADRLRDALPCLTYLTICSGVMNDNGYSELFDPSGALRLIRDSGIIPILKIFDKREPSALLASEKTEEFARRAVNAARERGFLGIALDFSDCPVTEGEALGFLSDLRSELIGSGLILIAEADGAAPFTVTDNADGAVLSLSFGENVSDICKKYAAGSECRKTFLELPMFALRSESFIPIMEAASEARRGSHVLSYNKEEMSLGFGKTKMPSLEYIKMLLGRVKEYGFMGVAFDTDRIPTSYLRMLSSMYKPLRSTAERAKEGCSRGG